jgi:hypothetical protein
MRKDYLIRTNVGDSLSLIIIDPTFHIRTARKKGTSDTRKEKKRNVTTYDICKEKRGNQYREERSSDICEEENDPTIFVKKRKTW